ncbi:hypothetical protein DFH29DRAFT_875630 [Suillus ampliporus]|nr:hypothetical protein DFH29DRAFT_875630 [Suillus ampliporus]
MGKYDHILELTGPDAYFAWKRETKYLLGIKDLWCHVSENADADDILGTPSYIPTAVAPTAPTAIETKEIRDWLVEDLKDASNYVGRHATLRERLLRMGASYSDEEAMFQLLRGLLKTGLWPQFKAQLTFFASGTSLFGSSATPLTFDSCVTRISAEAASSA